MSFKDEYTTDFLVQQSSGVVLVGPEGESLPNPEESKMVLSNDAYALGLLLETLINTKRV